MRSKLLVFVSKWRWWIGVGLGLAALGLWARWDFTTFQQKHETTRQTLAAIAPYRDVLDLHAQQSMSEFAYGVLLFSAFGLAVSITGAIALFATLRQNRTMIEATREIGENQVRAYLYPVHLSAFAGDESLQMTFVVQNAGSTPASQVVIKADFAYSGETALREPWKLHALNSSPTEVLSNSSSPVELGTSWSALDHWLDGAAGEGRPIVRKCVMFFGSIYYRDVFGAWFFTTFVAHFDLPRPSTGSFGVQFTAGSGGAFKPMTNAPSSLP